VLEGPSRVLEADARVVETYLGVLAAETGAQEARAPNSAPPQQTCVGKPTLRPLRFLLCRRFLSQNRGGPSRVLEADARVVETYLGVLAAETGAQEARAG
jgi:hypothetical protein